MRMRRLFLFISVLALELTAPASGLAFPLPGYDEGFIERFEQNPAAYEQDRNALIRFSEQYSLRLFNRIVSEYMTEHKLSSSPVPPDALDPLFAYTRRQPRSVIWEMVRFGNGMNTVIATIQLEIAKYEIREKKPVSIPPAPAFVFDSPGASPGEVSVKNEALAREVESLRRLNYACFAAIAVSFLLLYFRGRRARA